MKTNAAKNLVMILAAPVANDAATKAPVSTPAPAQKKASRGPRRVKRGFMVDVRAAARSNRRLELLIGVVFAGFVPLAVFETAHVAIPQVLGNAAAYGDWTQAFAAA